MKEPFLLIDAKKDATNIGAQGSMLDILTMLAKAINRLYFFIKSKDELMAEAFKETLTELFTDDDSLLWTDIEGEGVGAIYEIKKMTAGALTPTITRWSGNCEIPRSLYFTLLRRVLQVTKLEEAVEKISKLQPKTEDKLWNIGEQIKDIMRAEPRLADIIAEDLAEKTTCLIDIEKEIAKYARSHDYCCPPKASDNIIRKYFGLPKRGETPAPAESGSKKVVRLEDFL